MSRRTDKHEAFHRWKHFQQWERRLAARFEPSIAEEIMKSFLEECGGQRIWLPDLQDLWREQRDHAIRNKFAALAREVGPRDAYRQIALNNDLSIIQVRRIVNGTCGRKEK